MTYVYTIYIIQMYLMANIISHIYVNTNVNTYVYELVIFIYNLHNTCIVYPAFYKYVPSSPIIATRWQIAKCFQNKLFSTAAQKISKPSVKYIISSCHDEPSESKVPCRIMGINEKSYFSPRKEVIDFDLKDQSFKNL